LELYGDYRFRVLPKHTEPSKERIWATPLSAPVMEEADLVVAKFKKSYFWKLRLWNIPQPVSLILQKMETAPVLEYALQVQAQEVGQSLLAYEYRTKAEVKKLENKLCSFGFNYFLSESNVVEFIRKSTDWEMNAQQYLKWDWLRNFTHLLPPSIATLKLQLDEERIFDEWVVLYHNPKINSTDTGKNVFLFGLIENSRRLYFVTSWKEVGLWDPNP
jgi:hypothetical protein